MFKYIKTLFPVALIIAGITGCSDVNRSDSSEISVRLNDMLDETISEYQAPGAMLAIKLPDGSVAFHTAGYADMETKEPLTADHLFRIGSTTKTITAVAVLTLYQEGLLSLDASVETILPGVIPEYGDDITVRMLLNHTSGLKEYVVCPFEESYVFYILVDQPARHWPPQDLVDIAVEYGLADTPGQTFMYSNTNYILLGMIIEAISGQSYEDYIQTHIFDVMSMSHSLVPVEKGFSDDFAHGYYEKDGDSVLYDYSIQDPSAFWAAGNMISTPGDLLTWLEALATGALLNEDAFKQQFQLVDIGEEGQEAKYGLGILAAEGAVGHNGSVLGYQTQMFARNDSYMVIYTNCYYESQDNLSQIIYDRTTAIIDDHY
ncbi:MAG: serine hydrolase domain-containing protein [Fidelibacterota bacterium]